MNILASNEVWKEAGKEFVFDHIRVILRKGDHFYFAQQKDRYSPINLSKLNVQEVPKEHLSAPLPRGLTPAPEPLPEHAYTKLPNLLSCGESPLSTNFCALLLQEAEVYELLHRNPHPNIAQYYGCVVQGGKFRGICLKRYPTTLEQVVSAGAAFAKSAHFMQGIKDGVAHLHSLGLVHGDLNPSNIMVDCDTAIIIDFDSCRRNGDPVGLKGSTLGWGTSTDYACPESDLRSLAMIERYIFGESFTLS
ncbi:kinase-like domain-containing protein [Annulohypoxylon moriforme]|nr:kinase-like domain-containing protein [Annulohypoxylon moriforme]